jgi:HSP20 family protein
MEDIMALVKWDPIRELDEIQTRLGRLFPARQGRQANEEEDLFADWSPATDVQETDTEFIIKTDLPEVAKEDVKVHLQEGVLTVEGERKREKEEKGRKFHKIEREYGKFVRRFALPTETDAVNVRADFKNGVLTVHLPKSAKATPTTIEVKVA